MRLKLVPCRKALLLAVLSVAFAAGAQQTVTPPAAPTRGTVPITSQTPVTSTGSTAPLGTPPAKGDLKAQRKDQKQQEKIAKENTKSAKEQSKAAKSQEHALKEKNKAAINAEKAQQPQP